MLQVDDWVLIVHDEKPDERAARKGETARPRQTGRPQRVTFVDRVASIKNGKVKFVADTTLETDEDGKETPASKQASRDRGDKIRAVQPFEVVWFPTSIPFGPGTRIDLDDEVHEKVLVPHGEKLKSQRDKEKV
jgi:hypothetical protein